MLEVNDGTHYANKFAKELTAIHVQHPWRDLNSGDQPHNRVIHCARQSHISTFNTVSLSTRLYIFAVFPSSSGMAISGAVVGYKTGI